MQQRTAARSGKPSLGIVWGGMTHMTMQTKAPESQFAYVVLAARRARQLMAGAPPLIENPRTLKATRIACEELEHSLIEYDFTEPSSIDEDKDGNKRRKQCRGRSWDQPLQQEPGKSDANHPWRNRRSGGLQSRGAGPPSAAGWFQLAGGDDPWRAGVCHPADIRGADRPESDHGFVRGVRRRSQPRERHRAHRRGTAHRPAAGSSRDRG